MKKISLTLLSILYSSLLFTQTIEGKWLFESILSENNPTTENIKPIKEGDFMLIQNDGTFNYEISEISLIAEGTWDCLLYTSPSPRDQA